MRNIFLFSALMVAAQIANAGVFTGQAKVESVTPITENVTSPSQNCWTENQPAPQQNHNYMGNVLGAVVGGLLGNTVGGGNGRIAAAAVGAAGGAVAGGAIQNQQNANTTQSTQRCETVNNSQRQVTGYSVFYSFNGQFFTERMAQAPRVGSMIPVIVDVKLAYNN
jgi:uncharacterized protein YcfJ